MTADWANLAGHAINGVFPVLRVLGTSERSAVFLSRAATNTPSSVALKLVPAISGRAELLLPRWRAAMALDHPHLLRLLEAGECEVEGQRFLYLVMEYAEQNLAQLLEHRALGPDEVREMLGPTLSALGFLHGAKLVHGGLKPSNVLVVGEQIKLASDSIGPASDLVSNGSERVPTMSPYQPPEAGSGVRSAAGDVWTLGVMTCEALSRRTPAGVHAIAGSIVLPPDIPSTFREMILKCVSRKPEDRPDVAKLQAWLKGGELEPMPAAPQEAGVSKVAQKAPSSSSIRLVIRAEINPQSEVEEPMELKPRWRPVRLIGAAALFLAIVGTGIYFFSSGETPREAHGPVAAPPVVPEERSPQAAAAQARRTQAPATEAPTTGAPTTQAPTTRASTTAAPRAQAPAASAPKTRPPAASGSKAQPSGTSALASAAPTPRSPGKGAPAAEAPPPVPAPQAAASDSPSAINEVIPAVPRSASDTIRGTVRVSVRVIVDDDGNVLAATSEDPGPSRYFERLSLEAAKKWMFAPADTGENRLMVVKFNYTRFGTTAAASPAQ